MSRQWPESQKAWHLLAADWADMQLELKNQVREDLAAEETADYYLYGDPPLTAEEEETLF